MPLTVKGRKVLKAFKAEYGKKKGVSIFHATINKKPGQTKSWHKLMR